MKKKNKTTTSTTTKTSAATDLKSLINTHSLFFDKLVELIPAKFYLPNDDADTKPWFKGLSKIAKASLKQQTRQNIKLARRDRHDPDKISSSSTLDLLQQSLTKPEQAEKTDVVVDKDEDEDEIAPLGQYNDNERESVTYEELRQRLRRKIESLRGNRGGEKAVKNEKAKENEKGGVVKRGGDEKKRKREEEEVRVSADGVIEEGIEFGKVKLGDEETGEKRKKRKVPKAKELEKARRLQEMKRENPAAAEKEWWKAATTRAYGGKVHDNPRKMIDSIKKNQRQRVKSAEDWKERVERKNKMKSDRQRKRTDNIAERAKDKKARKIAKREKKLMRPGFEGRKEGYITKT